jgi:hypothetical protein
LESPAQLARILQVYGKLDYLIRQIVGRSADGKRAIAAVNSVREVALGTIRLTGRSRATVRRTD